MYPADDLKSLQRLKLLRIHRSARLRGEVVAACTTLAYPVTVAEQVVLVVKKFSPLLALASVFVTKKLPVRRGMGVVGTAMKWAPTLLRAVKFFRSSREKPQTSS